MMMLLIATFITVIPANGSDTYLDNGVLYQRELAWYQYWDGCRWQWASYYVYKPVAKASDPDFRVKLLDLAAARDGREQANRAEALRQTNFLEAVEALGLTGNFRLNNYGADTYPARASAQAPLSSAGVNGQTIYGYSYSSIADVYGVDLNALYQQASRLTQNAQTLAGQAHTDFSDVLKQEGANRARVAEILAKGQAAAQVAKAVEASQTVRVESREFRFRVEPDGKITQIPEPTATISGVFAPAKCVGCHAGTKKEGGFAVALFPKMSVEDKRKVWELLVSPDLTKRMPKGQPALTAEELKVFFQ